ncbi:RRQRL motif-containing zinc-binding protein [Amycolatopsis sp. NPDC058986]|uniref:RRQRL motif-containing zinc-binding protein n=1 Tax=unclassified Amycolatopsis TaxID=2618356 RepID=UPI00366DCD65
MSGKRQWPYVWQHVDGLGEVLTRGTFDGLPVLAWGWAPREIFATYRQLRAMGRRPGGHAPVACLRFQHRREGLRAQDFALLYLVSRSVPKRTATNDQLNAIALALQARRICQRGRGGCGEEQTYYLSTISRLCSDCETRTRFWERHAAQRGYALAA